jgi:hypothetical protein
MKKLLGIVVLGLLCCGTANARDESVSGNEMMKTLGTEKNYVYKYAHYNKINFLKKDPTTFKKLIFKGEKIINNVSKLEKYSDHSLGKTKTFKSFKFLAEYEDNITVELFIEHNIANAGDNKICDWVVNDAYPDILKEFPKDKKYFYVVKGDDGRCEYGHGQDKKSGFSDCEKHRKENGINGKCKLFAIGKKIILEKKDKKLKKAEKEAEKTALYYSHMFGQLPHFLKIYTKKLYIHKDIGKDDGTWWTIHGLPEIHINESNCDAQRKRKFKIYYSHCTKVMIHESSHIFEQNTKLISRSKWNKAKKLDKNLYCSKYSKFDFHEDFAESVLCWMGVRYLSNKMKKSNVKKIKQYIPNRLKFLDEMNFNMHPYK